MDIILNTDQYKFTIAEAGYPLREETFYYSHRCGGPHYLPIDIKKYIKDIFAGWGELNVGEIRYDLNRVSKLSIGTWFEYFSKIDPMDHIEIKSLPKGSWFGDGDPVFTVTGPSFLLSWLEPLLLQLNYRIQIASLVLRDELKPNDINMVTCEEQSKIVYDTIESLPSYPDWYNNKFKINVQSGSYIENIKSRIYEILNIVKCGERIFEVGLRAATCISQHNLTLEACKSAGLSFTSDTFGACILDMNTISKMSHEHVQRFGSDEAAYNAISDRIPGSIFCLLDTFDVIKSGIPAAFNLIKRQSDRNHVIMFNSGNIKDQFEYAINLASSMGINVRYYLEDGLNLEKTKIFEEFRKHKGLESYQVLYGYGGYLVNCGWGRLTSDRVSAVWELSETGGEASMECSEGKCSIPGRPILWLSRKSFRNLPRAIIAQEGEELSLPFRDLYFNAFENEVLVHNLIKSNKYSIYSDTTKLLRNKLMLSL